MTRDHSHTSPGLLHIAFLIVLIACISASILAQELEPRNVTNIPVNTHFVGVGYAYATGNYLLDPSLPIDDLEAKLHTAVVSYVHAFNFLGKSAKVDVVAPWASGNWQGSLGGIDTTTHRIGLGDLRLRLTVNIIGAPALSANQYKNYNQKTIVGLSLQVINPIGTYYSDKLINLGSNRWTLRPQIGVSHKANKWFIEAYLGAWLFGDNPDYYNGNKLKQKPLFTSKIHLIYSFKYNIWAAANLGYAIGGQTQLNDYTREDKLSTFRLGLTAAFPIHPQHTIKVSAYSGIRIERGPDFEAVAIVYNYRWTKKSGKDINHKSNNLENNYSITPEN